MLLATAKEMGVTQRTVLTGFELLKETIHATVDSMENFEESVVRRRAGGSLSLTNQFLQVRKLSETRTRAAEANHESTAGAGVAGTASGLHHHKGAYQRSKLLIPSSVFSRSTLQPANSTLSKFLLLCQGNIRESQEDCAFPESTRGVSPDLDPKRGQLSMLKTRGELLDPASHSTMPTLADELNRVRDYVRSRPWFDSFNVLDIELRLWQTYTKYSAPECTPTRTFLRITNICN